MKHLGFKIIFLLILLVGGLFFYGISIAPNIIDTHEYKIKIKNLTDNFEGFKIVHISDILYGSNYNEENLKNLVKEVNKTNPDIVVLTGDLINKNNKLTTESADKISEILSKIEATCGKYAITGDNDYKFDEWQNIIKNSNFINLNNAYDTIYKKGYNYFLIAGVSTFADKESINDKAKTTLEYINSLETNGPIYKILIMHEPDYIDDLTTNPFNLVLAGHINSQLKIPVYGAAYKPEGAKKYYKDYYKLKTSDLYISSGIGGSEYKFRLGCNPSINVYRLTK